MSPVGSGGGSKVGLEASERLVHAASELVEVHRVVARAVRHADASPDIHEAEVREQGLQPQHDIKKHSDCRDVLGRVSDTAPDVLVQSDDANAAGLDGGGKVDAELFDTYASGNAAGRTRASSSADANDSW